MENLPNQIKSIIFDEPFLGSYYNQNLNSLPDSVEYIKLPKNYMVTINKLPKNLFTIECDKGYRFINENTHLKLIYY